MSDPVSAAGRVNGPRERTPRPWQESDDGILSPSISGIQPLLRTSEVQRLLGLGARTVWSLSASGELPSVRLRGAVRYRVEDVRAFILRNRREASRG